MKYLNWGAMTDDAGSEDLLSLRVFSENLRKKNNAESCGVWND